MVRRRVVPLVVITAACAVLSAPGSVSAAPGNGTADTGGCAARLYDPGQHLGSGDTVRKLREDIDTLADDGATVRVRVYGQVPHNDLDAAEASAEADCPSWRHDGYRRDSLLVVMLATTSRRTGIYYGSDYDDDLDDSWRSIQREEMNPHFKQGEYAAGVDAGIRAIDDKVDDKFLGIGRVWWVLGGVFLPFPLFLCYAGIHDAIKWRRARKYPPRGGSGTGSRSRSSSGYGAGYGYTGGFSGGHSGGGGGHSDGGGGSSGW